MIEAFEILIPGSTWHCPTHLMPRISLAKKPKVGETLELVLKDFMVYLACNFQINLGIKVPARYRWQMIYDDPHLQIYQ